MGYFYKIGKFDDITEKTIVVYFDQHSGAAPPNAVSKCWKTLIFYELIEILKKKGLFTPKHHQPAFRGGYFSP